MVISSFADAEAASNRSGGALPSSHPSLEKELEAATQAIREFCGWHIATKEQVSYKRVRPFQSQVWLPAMQIDSIISVQADGRNIDPEDVEFDPQTGFTTLVARNISIEFVAGYEEVPSDLVALTLELAAGGLSSPMGIGTERAGGVSVTYERTSGSLAPSDLARLEPYKLGYLP